MASPEPQKMLRLREPLAMRVIPLAKHLKGGEELATMGLTLPASCRDMAETEKLFSRLWTRRMLESPPNVPEFNKQWKNSS